MPHNRTAQNTVCVKKAKFHRCVYIRTVVLIFSRLSANFYRLHDGLGERTIQRVDGNALKL